MGCSYPELFFKNLRWCFISCWTTIKHLTLNSCPALRFELEHGYSYAWLKVTAMLRVFLPFHSVEEWRLWERNKTHLKKWGRSIFTDRLANLEWWIPWWSGNGDDDDRAMRSRGTVNSEGEALVRSLWRHNKREPISSACAQVYTS